jgi:ubiquinone/menaquinone biosynthesis C-methylase UbiE
MNQTTDSYTNPASNYKEVWNCLSETLEEAVCYVTGPATEQELRKSGLSDALRIIEKIKINPSDVVLEVGCGVGRLGYTLADHCYKWIGCDISSNMIRHAQSRLKEKSNVEFILLDSNSLAQIRSNSVNALYCSVVFMHLDEWDRFTYIEEAYRVLKHGGRIYFDNFNLASEEGWKIFINHKAIPVTQRDLHISRSSTPDEFAVYLERAGFEERCIQTEDMWIVATATKI